MTQRSQLKSRMLKAGIWLLGSNLSSQLLRLLSNLILTRLLMPSAFGLAAAVSTIYFGLILFSDLGVWQSVVKSKSGTDSRYLGTAWAIQLLRSILLGFIILLIAFGLNLAARAGLFTPGTVYEDSRLPWMLSIFSICAIIQGLESMKIAIAQRELKGGQIARLELGSQIIAMFTTITVVWFTRSVWGLVIGTVTYSLARTLLSHFYLPGHSPRPCWDRVHAREIFDFGKWIFISSIVGFLASNGEKFILGGTLSVATFGVFSIAAALLASVIGLYGSIHGHIIFSSFSIAMRDDDSHHLYAKVQKYADIMLGLCSGTLFLSGQWIVWLIYDPRYHDAGWMLQWLSLGLVGIRYQIVEQLMFARGEPAWVSANNLLRTIGLILLIPLFYRLAGERGAIAAVVISQFASWPLTLIFKYKQNLLNITTEKWWLPSLGVGLSIGWVLNMLLESHFL